VIDLPMLATTLAQAWELSNPQIVAHHGGMGSATWFVTQDGRRWVAKAVAPALRRQFVGGLAVAATVEAAGIPAGAGVPTRDGQAVTTVAEHPLALLRWVAGEPLTGVGRDEQQLIGETLARVHRSLEGVSAAEADRFHWVRPEADHLAIRPWVRPAVAAAVAALETIGVHSLSWGLLHTDPAPEHFRLEAATGQCGLIDWSVALEGPLLYDLASAVMYVGGPGRADSLVEAYLHQSVLPAAEVEQVMLIMLRFRWAVQADYFAHRIANHDFTGIGGPADNEQGLEDARQWLDHLGGTG
jgi:Ser/Thr protein kinase RdoA (MazF antagonist)